LTDQVYAKDVLKCTITTASGERCVIITLVTQRHELFVPCSDTKMPASILVTAMVPVVERFGWTAFSAMERKRTLTVVGTAAGAITAVNTMKTSPSRVSVE